MFTRDKCSIQQAGQTMVEFALVIPLLLLLVFGIMEFGRAFYAYSAISNAAREGARFGVTDPTNTAGIKNQAITTATALGLTENDVSVSCSPCTSGNPIRVDVTYNFQSVIPLIIPNFTLRTAATMSIE